MTEIHPAHLLKRVAALFVDLGILYAVGFFISILFEDPLLALGNYKLLIGVLVSIIYFTFFHSEFGKGQTLGKKIFGFRVVSLNGGYLNLGEALIRSAIFAVPYCLSDLLNINSENSIGIFDFVRYTIIPASLFINHFFIFLNPLRQCYYDTLINSVVIEEVGDSIANPLNNPWMKYIPSLAMILIVIIGFIKLNPLSSDNRTDLEQLSEIKENITQERYLHFSKFYFTYPKNDPYQKTLKIDCYITGNEDISSEIYLITEELSPLKDKFNIKKITLSVVRDFNLGIFSSWEVLKKNEKQLKFDL
ncbi:MAG: RDD family protein [Chitinophagales bacterium]|jgi:uncharacterized RDD family membrane protein YckC|nr:RDD family protein [Sphingobacteriales bacterium]